MILWEKIPLIFPIYFSLFDQWDFFFAMEEYPIIDELGHGHLYLINRFLFFLMLCAPYRMINNNAKPFLGKLLNPCLKIQKKKLAKRLLLRHYESAIYKKIFITGFRVCQIQDLGQSFLMPHKSGNTGNTNGNLFCKNSRSHFFQRI